jgi:hypothetical protein
MKLRPNSLIALGFWTLSAAACAGKLSVGERPQGDQAQSSGNIDAGTSFELTVQSDSGTEDLLPEAGGPSGGSGGTRGAGGNGGVTHSTSAPGVAPSSSATPTASMEPSASAGGSGGMAGAGAGGSSGIDNAGPGGAVGIGGNFSEGVAGTSGSAGASSNGGNSWVEEAMPTTPAPGSSDGCPVGPLYPDSVCDSPGLTCAYHYEATDYQECSCRRELNAESTWECFGAGVQQQDSCPPQPPEADTECFGYYGLTCWYPPQIECWCDAEPGVWECLLPPDVDVPEPPDTDSAEVQIPELTDEQRQTWCEWYSELAAGGPGHPPTADLPVDGSGYTSSGACRSGGSCQATLPIVSAAQCAANLSLSQCEAPLSLLTECVDNALGGACLADEYACIDLAEIQNCSGTLVTVSASGFTPSCGVKVSEPNEPDAG